MDARDAANAALYSAAAKRAATLYAAAVTRRASLLQATNTCADLSPSPSLPSDAAGIATAANDAAQHAVHSARSSLATTPRGTPRYVAAVSVTSEYVQELLRGRRTPRGARLSLEAVLARSQPATPREEVALLSSRSASAPVSRAREVLAAELSAAVEERTLLARADALLAAELAEAVLTAAVPEDTCAQSGNTDTPRSPEADPFAAELLAELVIREALTDTSRRELAEEFVTAAINHAHREQMVSLVQAALRARRAVLDTAGLRTVRSVAVVATFVRGLWCRRLIPRQRLRCSRRVLRRVFAGYAARAQCAGMARAVGTVQRFARARLSDGVALLNRVSVHGTLLLRFATARHSLVVAREARRRQSRKALLLVQAACRARYQQLLSARMLVFKWLTASNQDRVTGLMRRMLCFIPEADGVGNCSGRFDHRRQPEELAVPDGTFVLPALQQEPPRPMTTPVRPRAKIAAVKAQRAATPLPALGAATPPRPRSFMPDGEHRLQATPLLSSGSAVVGGTKPRKAKSPRASSAVSRRRRYAEYLDDDEERPEYTLGAARREILQLLQASPARSGGQRVAATSSQLMDAASKAERLHKLSNTRRTWR